MSTRFYFPSAGMPAQLSSMPALWSQSSLIRRKLVRVKTDSPFASYSSVKGAGNQRELHQYTSESLAEQNISGTVQIAISCFQTAAVGAYLQVTIRVISETGRVVRGTLYAGQAAVTTSTNPADPNYIFATGAAEANGKVRVLNLNLSSLDVNDGDRLEVTLGYYHTYTGGFDRRGILTLGDPTASVDMPATVDAVAYDQAPWIEFSQTLQFEIEPLRVEEVGTAFKTSVTTTLTLDYPATIKENDLLFLWITAGGLAAMPATPDGYTLVYSNSNTNGISSHDISSFLYQKRAAADGPFSEVITYVNTNWIASVVAYRNAKIAGSAGALSSSGVHVTADIAVPPDRTQCKGLGFYSCGYHTSTPYWWHGGRILIDQIADAERLSKIVEYSFDWVGASVAVPTADHTGSLEAYGAHLQVDAYVLLAYDAPLVKGIGGGQLYWKKPSDSTWTEVKRVS